MEKAYEAVGALIRRYREERGLLQESVAVLMSERLGREFRQNLVSKHERGDNWRSRDYDAFELMRVYCEVLGIPQNEMIAAMGFPSALGGPPPPGAPTLTDFIERDPTLSQAAKDHLVNQYGLLQLASKNEIGRKLPRKHREAG